MTTPLHGGREHPSPTRAVAFVILFAVATAAAGYWIHHRDTTHGDHWDWSDWLEAILASLAVGLLLAGGLLKVAGFAVRRR